MSSRSIISALVLFLLVLMFTCSLCGKEFRYQHGVSVHEPTCPKRKDLNFSNFARIRGRHGQDNGAPPAKRLRTTKRNIPKAEEPSQISEGPGLANDGHEFGNSEASDHQSGSYAADRIDAPPPPTPEPVPSSRSGRPLRFPKHFNDYLPSHSTPMSASLSHIPVRSKENPPSAPAPAPGRISREIEEPSAPPVPRAIRDPVETVPNGMGVYRSYPDRPTADPEENLSLSDICESSTLLQAKQSDSLFSRLALRLPAIPDLPDFAPFFNATVFRLMNWMYTGSSMKSVAELDRLISEVIAPEDFDKAHLAGFSAKRETDRLDAFNNSSHNPLQASDGWHEASVKIRLPAEKHCNASEDHAPEIEVKGLFYRNLLETIKTAVQDTSDYAFHYTPFRRFWKPTPDSPPVRIYDELYTSDAWLEAHEEIKAQPREPGCTLETAIVALMMWSDSTHLASFGTASLWPIYLFFGNQSKYDRSKPSKATCHHLAYIPTLPAIFQDVYESIFGHAATSNVLTHCKRELMHAIWALLLDAKFMEAYIRGIVIECADGIVRRLFPRFFTYSADYPEKVLLATIQSLGRCPCPLCTVKMDRIPEIGTKNDMQRRESHIRLDNQARRDKVEMTRRWIFTRGYKTDGDQVKRVLGSESLVPIRNAFSSFFAGFMSTFNYFSMFVPDLLHEFELGVWKATFTHLIRLLYAQGGNAIQQLNKRYRAVPTFGRNATIRKFHQNASAMKKLAGRDFEDLLQCAIPVFEGLLPDPYNDIILDLLFTLATWHALAKLRLHTDMTLNFLEVATTAIGQQLRRFKRTVCEAYVTVELPREEAARGRRKAALAGKNGATPRRTAKLGRKGLRKYFNLKIFKLHMLGHYLAMIRRFGTTDSYNSQRGEQEHKKVKRYYGRTNKSNAVRQITRLERRERILMRMKQNQTAAPTRRKKSRRTRPSLGFAESDPLPYTSPRVHFHISDSNRNHVDVTEFLDDNDDDPALQNFLPRLKDHLLARVLKLQYDGDEHEFSDSDRQSLTFVNNRIYEHKVLRINYTTYDMRREQDSINPRTHPDVMVLSREDDEDPRTRHPYWYARVIGVYHTDVRHTGPSSTNFEPQRMEFLWVRWFGRDPQYRHGWNARRLPRIGFVPSDDVAAFGFLDPNEIIRGAHLIPAFHHGRTDQLLGPSIVRQETDEDKDWVNYYVSIFVDRDMFMRYRGGGVGHQATRHADQDLQRGDLNINAEDDDNSTEIESESDPEDWVGIGEAIENSADSGDVEDDGGQEDEEWASDEEHEEQDNNVRGDSDRDDGDSDLGAEDGEDGEEDLVNELGYDAL